MKKISFKSMRTRLTFWFLLLAIVPLFISLIIENNRDAKVIAQENYEKLTAIRNLKVKQLQNWLNDRISDLLTVSSDSELAVLEEIMFKKQKEQDDFQKIANIHRILKRYNENYKAYDELFILNPKTGAIEISTSPASEGRDKSDNTYYTETIKKKGMHIKDIYYSETYNEFNMTFSIPIFCSQHKPPHIIGIMVARVNLNTSLYSLLLDRTGLGETGETLIVNSEGYALNELRWYENAPLNLKIEAEPALNASQGKTGITKTLDYRGEPILAAYTHIPQTGWGFVAKRDLYELNKPIRKMNVNFIILLSVTVLLIMLITFFVSGAISKPITQMINVAQKIKGGDYSARNVIRSHDELGSLGESINEMTASIESSRTTLKGARGISDSIVSQASMEDFGSELMQKMMEITGANMSVFYILNEQTSEFEHFTSIGANKEMLRSFSAANPEGELGNAVSKKEIYYLRNIPEDTIFKFKTTAGDAVPREMITIPILSDDTVVALISLVNIHKCKQESYDILEQSWMNINSSYENLLANERTRILAEQLSQSNQKLESQTEELESQAEELQQTSDELQEQNLELEAQRKQVETANTLKSEFLANMSHELRTPLNSIMSLSQVLREQAKDKLSDEEKNYLEIVNRNGKQLLVFINDILDLSKIESGKMEITVAHISPGSLLTTLKENLEPLAEEKGLTLTLKLPADLPKIETDEGKMQQALSNIIGNAVKFTKKGTVDIIVNHDSENLSIKVQDTGIGIQKDALPYIFEEFKQVDGSTSRQFEGTGLGLAIAHRLIKTLDGDISVASKLGKGTTFIVTLPFKWRGDPDYREFTKPEMLEKTPAPEKEKSDSRILIVEDNDAAIIQTKLVLEKNAYKVDVVRSGKQALEYIKHNIPDGIILDLMMPEVDGFEVLNKIRSIAQTRDIPVLVLTAKDLTRKDLAELKANNIQQLVQKGDINIDNLLLKVKQMLGHKQPRVLVVEDNPDNMTTVKAVLGNKYKILEALDGKEGLNKVKSERPDLVLLDISLPGMDGLEVVSIIRDSEEIKDTPVIALTAKAMKGDREDILSAGCDDYIPKPINPKLLIKVISKWLGKKMK